MEEICNYFISPTLKDSVNHPWKDYPFGLSSQYLGIFGIEVMEANFQ